jgi:beta-lactamase class C
MTGMKIRTLNVIVISCLFLQATSVFSAPGAQQPKEQELANRFAAYFNTQVTSANITGAAFVVASPAGTVRIGTTGYTDSSHSRAIDENTTFRVASVSKTFAAGLAALLVREGEFSWEDPVTAYVPDFRIDGDSRRVQIQHVLGQSTGLISHAYDNLIEDGVSLERIQDQYRNLAYICSPGKCYSYQNSIFSLIQPVIENTTRQSYSELMQEKIFRPLDMKTASVGYGPFINNPNHASPHVKSRDRWRTVKVKPNYYRVAPAAGVNASVTDMGKWLTAQMGGNPAVIDPEAVETVTRPRVKTVRDTRRKFWRDMLSEAHYGLGWRVYQLGAHKIIYHSGWVSGYRADIAWSEEHKIGIAILMNVEDNSISELTTTFWQMAFDMLEPVTPGQGSARIAAALPGAGTP